MKKNYNDYAVDELVAQYKQDKNERVFAEIMEKTKGLIYVFARSYSRSIIGAEMEDLISEGNLILWDAVQTFDDTRDCRFTTYLCGCLKRNYNTLFSMCNCKKRIYTGKTPADGIIFVFNQGDGQNRYITSSLEEIKLLRGYIKTLVNKSIYEVK